MARSLSTEINPCKFTRPSAANSRLLVSYCYITPCSLLSASNSQWAVSITHARPTEVTVLFRLPTSFLSVIQCRYSVRVHISVALLSPIFIEIRHTYVRFRIPARQALDNTAHTSLCQDVMRDAIYNTRFQNIKCSQPYTIHITHFRSLGHEKYQLEYYLNHS